MEQNSQISRSTDPAALRAQLRMSVYLLLLFAALITMAFLSIPFVGHTTVGQNMRYSFLVGAPFIAANIAYIVLVLKDLSKHGKK